DAIADRVGELGRARDQLLLLGIVFERTLGQRADQDFQEFWIDAAGGTVGGRGGHTGTPVPQLVSFAGILCVTPALVPFLLRPLFATVVTPITAAASRRRWPSWPARSRSRQSGFQRGF